MAKTSYEDILLPNPGLVKPGVFNLVRQGFYRPAVCPVHNQNQSKYVLHQLRIEPYNLYCFSPSSPPGN